MRYLIRAAAFNLWIVLRQLFGIGTPRSLQGFAGAVSAMLTLLQIAYLMFCRAIARLDGIAHRPNDSGLPWAVAFTA